MAKFRTTFKLFKRLYKMLNIVLRKINIWNKHIFQKLGIR